MVLWCEHKMCDVCATGKIWNQSIRKLRISRQKNVAFFFSITVANIKMKCDGNRNEFRTVSRRRVRNKMTLHLWLLNIWAFSRLVFIFHKTLNTVCVCVCYDWARRFELLARTCCMHIAYIYTFLPYFGLKCKSGYNPGSCMLFEYIFWLSLNGFEKSRDHFQIETFSSYFQIDRWMPSFALTS